MSANIGLTFSIRVHVANGTWGRLTAMEDAVIGLLEVNELFPGMQVELLDAEFKDYGKGGQVLYGADDIVELMQEAEKTRSTGFGIETEEEEEEESKPNEESNPGVF